MLPWPSSNLRGNGVPPPLGPYTDVAGEWDAHNVILLVMLAFSGGLALAVAAQFPLPAASYGKFLKPGKSGWSLDVPVEGRLAWVVIVWADAVEDEGSNHGARPRA